LFEIWQSGAISTADERPFLLAGNWISSTGLATVPSDRARQTMESRSYLLSFPDSYGDLFCNRQIICRIFILPILSHAIVGGNMLVRKLSFPNSQRRRLRRTEFGCHSLTTHFRVALSSPRVRAGARRTRLQDWIEHRLKEPAGIFAFAVGGFSVMDNHISFA
jgi:hypothetical protein